MDAHGGHGPLRNRRVHAHRHQPISRRRQSDHQRLVSWPGAARRTSRPASRPPLEEALAQVEGVQTITSSSSTGSARITATFDLSRDIDLALQDTQAKIAQSQRGLPADAQPPVVSKSNPDDQPILTIGVSGPFAKQLLGDVARYQVEDRLQTIPGVGQVTTMGYVDREIRIWLDADKLNSTGLVVTDVQQALQKSTSRCRRARWIRSRKT